jgi:hypothetical protein
MMIGNFGVLAAVAAAGLATALPDSALATTRMRVEFSAGSMHRSLGNNVFETANYGVVGVVEFSFTADQINQRTPEGLWPQRLDRIMITPTFTEVWQGYSIYSIPFSKPIGVVLSGSESYLNINIGSIDPGNGVGYVKTKSDDWALYRGYGANSLVPFTSYDQAQPNAVWPVFANCWSCGGQEFLTASFRVLADAVPPPAHLPAPPAPPPPYSGSMVHPSTPPTGFDSPVITPPGFNPPGTVPEPATWALMVGGFGLVGGALRRKAKPFAA